MKKDNIVIKKKININKNQKKILILKLSRLIKNKLKNEYGFNYISKDSTILFSGILYYLIKEIFIISCQTMNLNNKLQITPRILNLTIKSDVELKEFLKTVIISKGGYVKKQD